MPSSDAQLPGPLPHRQPMVPPTRSTSAGQQAHPLAAFPAPSPSPSSSSGPLMPASSAPMAVESPLTPFDEAGPEHALDFATHSWDLATGGLKTLTAKREFPVRPGRRAIIANTEETAARNYTMVLVIMLCVILMLIGGGIVLFVMLQP